MRFITTGSVWSFAVTVALFTACSNDSGSSGHGGSGGSGASSGSGGTSAGSSGDAGDADASGGTSGKGGTGANGGTGGEAGGLEAGAGNVTPGGTGGTGGESTGGTGGKGTTPTPNVGCTGSVTSEQSHELTSCGLSVSKIAGSGQTQFSLELQGKDADDHGLTLTLQFTDVPTASTYTFASSDYMAFDSTWNEGSTTYTATAYAGFAGIGDLTVEFDTIDGPFTLGSTTFYTVTGSVSGTLENPPSGSATLDLRF
jgi:hypothetical protein